jgi:hypothetical protein
MPEMELPSSVTMHGLLSGHQTPQAPFAAGGRTLQARRSLPRLLYRA